MWLALHVYTNVNNYVDTVKKYHEYLMRQQKPMSEKQLIASGKINRILQQRQRVSIHLC